MSGESRVDECILSLEAVMSASGEVEVSVFSDGMQLKVCSCGCHNRNNNVTCCRTMGVENCQGKGWSWVHLFSNRSMWAMRCSSES